MSPSNRLFDRYAAFLLSRSQDQWPMLTIGSLQYWLGQAGPGGPPEATREAVLAARQVLAAWDHVRTHHQREPARGCGHGQQHDQHRGQG